MIKRKIIRRNDSINYVDRKFEEMCIRVLEIREY